MIEQVCLCKPELWNSLGMIDPLLGAYFLPLASKYSNCIAKLEPGAVLHFWTRFL